MNRISWALVIFFASGIPVFANSSITYREESEKRIVQRIQWQEDDSVLNFLVEIQKNENGKWINKINQITENNYIEISLLHGLYRYRVTPSDLLGRRLPAAAWSELSIAQLFQPEITKYAPDTFYLDEDRAEFTLKLTGSNILQESRIFLRDEGGKEIEGDSFAVSKNGKTAQLEYKKAALSEGVFDLVVENPGGLNSVLRNFRVIKNKSSNRPDSPANFYVFEGYAPFIAFPGVFNNYFARRFFESGFNMRAGWQPIKFKNGLLGGEFSPSYHYLSKPVMNPNYSSYNIKAQLLDFRINAVWSKFLALRYKINLRAGAGITIFTDVHLEENRLRSPIQGGWTPSLDIGASVSFQIFSNFFIDAGTELLYIISVDNPPPVYLMPVLAIGFKF
ncbi:MAG: hypothetical protein LBD07_04700 [Spirochaetaceae bacterium]|jgi:hypothetical protein|nr:hypothetical protein [Spirochaetaceae bacterium]